MRRWIWSLHSLRAPARRGRYGQFYAFMQHSLTRLRPSIRHGAHAIARHRCGAHMARTATTPRGFCRILPAAFCRANIPHRAAGETNARRAALSRGWVDRGAQSHAAHRLTVRACRATSLSAAASCLARFAHFARVNARLWTAHARRSLSRAITALLPLKWSSTLCAVA